jgi:hypothetical protein
LLPIGTLIDPGDLIMLTSTAAAGSLKADVVQASVVNWATLVSGKLWLQTGTFVLADTPLCMHRMQLQQAMLAPVTSCYL